MPGPGPHGECVDGASIVGVAVGRPGGEQERDEVNIWLTNTASISPRAQRNGAAPQAQGLPPPEWDPSIDSPDTGLPSCLGPDARVHASYPSAQNPSLLAWLWTHLCDGKSQHPRTTQVSPHPILGLQGVGERREKRELVGKAGGGGKRKQRR